MVVADTSVWIDFSRGNQTPATALLRSALRESRLVMVPPVLFEVLSGPSTPVEARNEILSLPLLELGSDFWLRAAGMRQMILMKGQRACTLDCLVAQACIDHRKPLITSDHDYRHFIRFGLQLAT